LKRVEDWTDEEEESGKFDKFADLITPVKQVLLGNSVPAIGATEWEPIVEAAAGFYGLYLGIVNGMDSSLDAMFISRALPAGVAGVVEELEKATARHPGHHIPGRDWNALFAAVAEAEMLPDDFTADSLKDAWNWALKRLLGQSDIETGLGPAQMSVFKSRLAQWQDLLSAVENNQPLPVDFNQLVNDSEPLIWDAQGRMVIGPKAPKAWDVFGLRHMVWSYVLLDWVKTAFVGAEPKHLTIPEFATAVEEVLPVLQGFGWLTDSETDIYVRLQREADLFTLSSNGNRLLELSEAVRYLNFVVSAYQAADLWLDNVKAQGCVDLAPECVRAYAIQPGSPALDSMPFLKAFMTKQSPKVFDGYMKYAEEILFDSAKTDEIGIGDLLQVWALFQYVDTFIQRYDVNWNDTINADEGRTAFIVYGPILSDLLASANIPEVAKLPFFTFMLKFGDTPFLMIGGPVAFQYWRHHESAWLFESERTQLMSILRQLAQLKN
jgi:hypothetical protein